MTEDGIRRDPPSITCPRCGWKSFSAADVMMEWCGRCQSWHSIMTAELAAELVSIVASQMLGRHAGQIVLSRESVRHLMVLAGLNPPPLRYPREKGEGLVGPELTEPERQVALRAIVDDLEAADERRKHDH